MIIKSINLYTFKELCPEVQKKVMERYREIDVDDWWHGFIKDNWVERLDKRGYKNAKIFFSGFYSQGDGACFDATPDIKILRRGRGMKFRPIDHLLRNEYLSGAIKGGASRYSHENTRCFEIVDILADISKKQSDLINQLEDLLEKERIDLCRQIYRELREEYEYSTCDDHITETLIGAEFLFTADGQDEPLTKVTPCSAK